MWKWLHRRRARHRGADNVPTSVATPSSSNTSPSNDNTAGLQSLFFKPSVPIAAVPPKCLRRFTFSEILYGERIEDFSQDCWLQDHLHHFGLPSSPTRQFILRSPTSEGVTTHNPLIEEPDDSSTGTSSNNSSLVHYSDIENESDISGHESRPRLALEDLFNPLPDIDDDINSDYGDIILENPPPYSEFDLPPSYEEAVGAFERRSGGTRSSQGSSLAFMW